MMFTHRISATYRRCLEYPIAIMVVMFLLCVGAATQIHKLKVDASADTLIAENDPELAYYGHVIDTFGEQPFLVLTYTPLTGKLISAAQINQLQALIAEIRAIEGVDSVQTLLDVPLLSGISSPTEFADGLPTLADADVDFAQAEGELTQSPLFREVLISGDGQTTAIRINLEASLGDDETSDAALETVKAEHERVIESIRLVRTTFAHQATMHLGGVPMVASDMIAFLRADMIAFALAIVGLLSAALYLFFRRLRWVLFPLGSAAISNFLMLAVLALTDQPISAVSANFVALLAIISISFSVHLATAYRELYSRYADDERQCTLAYETMRAKLAPCIYTALTTVVAFASLTTSEIVPVVDFGWMMCIGIMISLVVTYSFFASVLVLLPKNESVNSATHTPRLTQWFSHHATKNAVQVLWVSLAVGVCAFFGVQQLEVGNRLVEYFRADTEIRQGLDFIDRELGGTIPLDVVIKFDPYEAQSVDEDDDFAFGTEPEPFPERYWFTPEKVRILEDLQAFMAAQPGIGKSISVSNLEQLARRFNDGQPLSYLMLTAVVGGLPESVRQSLLQPYASPNTGELRISARLKETGPNIDIDPLIESIRDFASHQLGLTPEAVHVTGVAVLFNDMLRQLLTSQISTLGFVLLATFVMFVLLLRSIKLAVIGLLPNVFAASVVLGVMGVLGIPLDVMTITIAAIVVGIGVDDAIHYLHRYRAERATGLSTVDAVRSTHATIGKALYFTSLTVVVGFSVLLFSRFVPNVYFGWLAALAMVIALTANLALLPALLVATDKWFERKVI